MHCNGEIQVAKKYRSRARKFCCHKCSTDFKSSLTTERDKLFRRKATEIWHNAKKRAKNKGLFFTLEKDFITDFPIYCPVLGIRLNWESGTGYDNSPSLDRINPNLGYTKDNVRIISHRANRLKCNASSNEMFLVLKDLIRNECK